MILSCCPRADAMWTVVMKNMDDEDVRIMEMTCYGGSNDVNKRKPIMRFTMHGGEDVHSEP